MNTNDSSGTAPLMLSVSGARGIVGKSMTPEVAWRLAAAFGNELQQATELRDPLVGVGRDSRPSSEMLGAAAVAGLLATGCRVMRLGCVMTPTAAVMIDHHRANGGIVITASHNPIEWNGLKCLNADGVAPPKTQAERIIARFKSNDLRLAAGHEMQPMLHDTSGAEVHVARVIEHLGDARATAIRKRGFKVVLDSVNGAGCEAGAMLLKLLGCELVHLNGEPTGHFAHTPEPTRENLTDLAEAVKQDKADIGFAQDPDADRLAIVDERGEYIGEEYTLVLACEAVLASHESKTDGNHRSIVTNLSTSRMMDDVARRHNAPLYRSAVGEANVVEIMKQHGSIVGGEGNGGIIWPKVTFVRDSLSGMTLTLALLAEREQPLSAIISDWPRYAFVKTKVEIREGMADTAIAALAKRFNAQSIDQTDGIRVEIATTDSELTNVSPGAWLHVRASNTEPILRILAEAPTNEEAVALVSAAQSALQ